MITTKADKWFSYFIRLRDSDENGFVRCCTCGLGRLWKYVDCGHYVGRQHNGSRFSETNCAGQCKGCNKFEEGRKDKHRDYILKKYGQQELDLIESSKRHNRQLKQFELDYIENEYKEKAKALAKSKGIKI